MRLRLVGRCGPALVVILALAGCGKEAASSDATDEKACDYVAEISTQSNDGVLDSATLEADLRAAYKATRPNPDTAVAKASVDALAHIDEDGSTGFRLGIRGLLEACDPLDL